MAPDTTEKIRENRLRRTARRRGLTLIKSRCREPRAIGYGGFGLLNERRFWVFGDAPYAFAATLDDIEDYLEDGD